jgi:hypothetical protein
VRKANSRARYTQADLDRAFARGVAEGRRLAAATPARKRGRPALKAEEVDKRWGEIFAFVRTENFERGKPISDVLDAAAENFGKDRKAIEKAWSKWAAPLMPTAYSADIVEGMRNGREVFGALIAQHCSREEIESAAREWMSSNSLVPWRRLLRTASRRKSTASKSR